MISSVAIFTVAIGGALGGAARYWVAGAVDRLGPHPLPLGTLLVNVTGSALIGALAAIVGAGAGDLTDPTRATWLFLAVGCLGSYTTVSSFSLETLELVRAGRPGRALANMMLSFGGCLAGAAAGYFVLGGLIGG